MIDLKLLLLILSSVSLSAIAQISFKFGMSSSPVQGIIRDSASRLEIIGVILFQPYVLLGLMCYVLGALMWLFVLSRLDVSMAYPFVGIGFILTMFLGALLLGEHIGITRVVGTALVVLGVVLVSRS